ncbi:hypothetical protein [Limnohabitans sp. MMS-10A-192]|uniref:hypothetical protein n=1 Tax=Limnohabitans sp. MMS-10A-192 TaxID=1835769 RepID=UPI0011B1ED8D|nr:hypothetical protein [Limnohabitans sp. MMS-10A-192]
MALLPQHISDRLKKAGAKAFHLRMADGVRGPRDPKYLALIAEIDATTAEARESLPHLYRKDTA